jgi:iron-sulfur cluster repair protein YtfE (RIC family)
MDGALLDELESQHRMVEDLLHKLESESDTTRQQRLVDELIAALTEHMEIEESQVYPGLQRVDPEIATEADVEHRLAREGISTLQSMVGMPGFGAAVAMLQAGIEHHVQEEEGEAFPKLREELGLSPSKAGATKQELYEEAKQAGVEGRSQMTKDELAEAVSEK